jgi:hypothetical protein
MGLDDFAGGAPRPAADVSVREIGDTDLASGLAG